MSVEKVELNAIVHGRVQKVGFRYTTVQVATLLGLSGSVQNRTDGSVEIIAQGPKDQLIELLRILQEDKFKGHVVNVDTQFYQISKAMTGFVVI